MTFESIAFSNVLNVNVSGSNLPLLFKMYITKNYSTIKYNIYIYTHTMKDYNEFTSV